MNHHPVLSIQARSQTFILKNFIHTPYAKYMKKIHNSHLNESCFVIGNGPSLSGRDLTELYERKIDSFGVNRIYKIFPQTKWNPTYYVSTDPLLIRDTIGEVEKMKGVVKFIPLQNKYYHNIVVKDAHYFYRNDIREKDQPEGFSLDCTSQVNMRGTVTIACIQLAMHMGYRHIYLLGIDHNFDKVVSEDGKIIINKNVRNYFVDGYDTDVANEVTHDLGNTTRAYKDIRRFCDSAGVEVLNATRTTKLEVFPRISFEEALEKIKNSR